MTLHQIIKAQLATPIEQRRGVRYLTNCRITSDPLGNTTISSCCGSLQVDNLEDFTHNNTGIVLWVTDEQHRFNENEQHKVDHIKLNRDGKWIYIKYRKATADSVSDVLIPYVETYREAEASVLPYLKSVFFENQVERQVFDFKTEQYIKVYKFPELIADLREDVLLFFVITNGQIKRFYNEIKKNKFSGYVSHKVSNIQNENYHRFNGGPERLTHNPANLNFFILSKPNLFTVNP